MYNIKKYKEWNNYINERDDIISKPDASDKIERDTEPLSELENFTDECLETLNTLAIMAKDCNKNCDILHECNDMLTDWKKSLSSDKDTSSELSDELIN